MINAIHDYTMHIFSIINAPLLHIILTINTGISYFVTAFILFIVRTGPIDYFEIYII